MKQIYNNNSVSFSFRTAFSLFLCLVLAIGASYGQIIGGDNIYEFLNSPPSARVTALGGTLISVRDDDASLAHENPALLNKGMHNQLSVNHVFHVLDIQQGYATYARHLEKWGITAQAGMQYISYGDFDARDETGALIGSFKANEYALSLGAGKQLYEKLAIGANLKLITSQLEDYNSVGLAADIGAYYQDTSGLFSAALVFKNAGIQLTKYDEVREDLPYDVQIAISQKLKYLPFRFTITYHNLHRWNIRYDDPNTEEDVFLLTDSTATSNDNFKVFADNLFRHMNFSGEFLLGKKQNLRIRVGYNHQRRKELTVDSFRSLTGFSAGIGMKINRFRISFGHAFYHLAGGTNHFSIATDLGSFRRRA